MKDKKPVNLAAVKAAKDESHQKKMMQLFTDHPEVLEQAIVITPDGMLTPEGLDPELIVARLEASKFAVLFALNIAAVQKR